MEFRSSQLVFDTRLELFSGRVALVTEDNNTFTYSELVQACDALNTKIGTEKQLLCVQSHMGVETIIGYLAGLRGNHTVMMLDAELNQELMDELLQTYQPDFIWKPLDEATPSLYKSMGYQLTKLKVSKARPLHEELALLLSTSGSTGSPKFVKLTKQNLYANTASIVEYLNISKEERAITSLPLHYSYGISVMNTHLAVGARLLVTKHSIISKEFWNFFKEAKATSFAGVPYTYEMLKKFRFFKMELPSLRTLTQAGGKLNPKLVEEFANYSKEKDIDFVVMYGQTEATARISYLPPKFNQTHPKSIGVPIPNGKIVLLDVDGNEITEIEKEGELAYKGKNVMMGYANAPEDLIKPDEMYELLKTGDIAYVDEEGFYYITGRIKRFIKIFGNRVNLDQVEHYLKVQGFDCLCTGEDNALRVAVLDTEIVDEIKVTIVDKFRLHHSVVEVVQVTNFPVTASGKIEYKKLFDYIEKRNT